MWLNGESSHVWRKRRRKTSSSDETDHISLHVSSRFTTCGSELTAAAGVARTRILYVFLEVYN